MRKKEPPGKIRFHYLQPARFPVGSVRKALFRLLVSHKRRPDSVNFVFCSDNYLRKINKSYLGHDYFTDIVTFDLSETKAALSADIFISVDRVRDNARSLEVPIYHELIRVVAHGALHLVGFSDKSAEGSRRMRAAEDAFLSGVLKSVPRETKAKKKFHVEHRRRVS